MDTPDPGLTEHPARRTRVGWHGTVVQGRRAAYALAGSGEVVVLFVHGWGLSHRVYERTLRSLARAGVQVLAPALPGFGGSDELPDESCTIAGYAAWTADFLAAIDVQAPVVVLGHSFGGGVAIQLAHDYPGSVRGLVLVNSIGGSAWRHRGAVVRSMAERPLWDWGLHFPADVLPAPQLTRVLPVLLAEAVPGMLRHPRAFWRVANLARFADLGGELDGLRRRRLPVAVLWGRNDKIITEASNDALCEALGADCVTVEGGHGWLLADPRAFGEVMTNVVGIAARHGVKAG
ncbi:MAG: alpha/beta hydrolase [Acidimicrobiia bacterium]